jgi:hypothetical protein
MDAKAIDKAEIAARLQTMVEKQLFGAEPWPIENNAAVHQQLLDWGLIVEIDNDGTTTATALGIELDVRLWTAFVGHHTASEIPEILVENGLLTQEEADHIIFNRWERDGEKLEDVLPPILRRVYLSQSD